MRKETTCPTEGSARNKPAWSALAKTAVFKNDRRNNGRLKMPNTTHSGAAASHVAAAKSHRMAADLHAKGENDKAHKASTDAHGHSEKAHAHSTDAHAKSSQHAKK